MSKRELYKIEGEKLIRLRRNCPKCGEGVFLADHKDRVSCGTCGYTEFKGGKPTPPQTPKPSAEAKKPKTPQKPPTTETPQPAP